MAKVRSPNYPTTDLGAALELIRPAFKAENRNKMSRAVLANHMGDKTLHGRALTKLGAVRAYGLIEGSGDDLRISDDAVTVLASPDTVNYHYRDALERLALKPQLFQDIKKQFPATLPSEHNLSFWLVQQHFTQEAAGKAAKSFLSTMRLVYPEPEAYKPEPASSPPASTMIDDALKGIAAGIGKHPMAPSIHELKVPQGSIDPAVMNVAMHGNMIIVSASVGLKGAKKLLKRLQASIALLEAEEGDRDEAAN
jgi:hypothetical protein